MTSIDELFKVSELWQWRATKRRRLRIEANDSVEGFHFFGKQAQTWAISGFEEGSSPDRTGAIRRDIAAGPVDDVDDAEAVPELPPDFNPDEVAGPDDDEEGRFFGGGVSKETIRAMDLVDRLEEKVSAPEKIDSAWLRKTAVNFEKRISKNAELRAKYESEPQKFLSSEADLDADIKSLSLLSENTHLYGEFADLGCAGSLVSLLAHENTDIAIDAIEVIAGLTDEDTECEQEDWDKLANAMLDSDLIELLASNLARLDESSEFDRAGVYHILSVIENLSSQVALSERICKDANILTWLLKRIQRNDSGLVFSQNKQYAAEVLSILVQLSKPNRAAILEHGKSDAIDTLLQQLSVYRRRDPEKRSEEEEFVENMFDCLTCLVDEVDGKEKFVQAEGVELCQIMILEGKLSKLRAIKVLSHACNGRGAVIVCEKLVEIALLKTIFRMFIKKVKFFRSVEIEHESPSRIRTLAKFMEKDYEKTEKVIKLRREYSSRLKIVEDGIAKERKGLSAEDQEYMEAEWLSRRLDNGLFSIQVIDVILAWLVAEDEAAKEKIKEILGDRDETLSVVKKTLQEQLNDLDETQEEEELNRKEMLSTLMKFLD
ncbi:hypothetical protein KEM54_000651 [Ascosphaera aggregata]|nr:hypothetical protein KEM54_000651 [Ascosphaera aggregata]